MRLWLHCELREAVMPELRLMLNAITWTARRTGEYYKISFKESPASVGGLGFGGESRARCCIADAKWEEMRNELHGKL